MWVSGEALGSQEDLILHPGARRLLDLWQGLKGERQLPGRADLDLRQLPRQAPWLFIVEPAGEALDYRYRLAGTGICGLLRREVTGTDFLAGWERFERGAIARALTAVTTRLRPAHFRLRFLTDRGQKIGADMLALPVLARDGTSIQVLGGLFPHASPEIWTYDTLTPTDLAAVRLLDVGRDSVAVAEETHAPRKFRLISGGLDHP